MEKEYASVAELPAALLNGLFEHPAGVLFMSHTYRLSKLAVSKWFSRKLLGRILEYVPVIFTVEY